MKIRSFKSTLSKNWKIYLLEFVMLFLAVFLGFLADGYRESRKERAIEKEYIKSLIIDAETDKAALEDLIQANKFREQYLDTLALLSSNYEELNVEDMSLYRLLPFLLAKPDFLNANELTISQLKNAGGLILIKNQKATSEIYYYEKCKQKLINQQFYYETYQNKAIASASKIMDIYKAWNALRSNTLAKDAANLNSDEFKLMRNDKIELIEFANDVTMFMGIVEHYTTLLEEAQMQLDALIETAKKEYNIP